MGPAPHPPQGDPLIEASPGPKGPAARSRSGPAGDRLGAAVLELPEGQRLVVVLHDVHGLALTDVASMLGIRTAAAGIRLRRGRQHLRRELFPVSGEGSRRRHGLHRTRHVQSCLRCQAELAQYRRLLRALHELGGSGADAPAATDPPAATDRPAAGRPARGRRRLAYAAVAGAAAAAAAAAAAGAAARGTARSR